MTVMGALLGNQRQVSIRHILEFKENLRILMISAVFVLLAARVRIDELAGLPAGAYVFLAVLILLVRPLAVLACTARANLDRPTRLNPCRRKQKKTLRKRTLPIDGPQQLIIVRKGILK